MDFGSIKNLGIAIADIIVEERKENGKYLSFTDFIKRLIHTKLNKKSVEALIKSGSFDSLEPNRGKLLASYEDILEYYSKKETNTGFENQASMFDMLDVKEEDRGETLYKEVQDLKEMQKLKDEKEMIGMYISGHPMAKIYRYLEKSISLNSKKYRSIKEGDILAKDGELITTAGIISSVKKKFSKKGNIMVFLEIEDIYGTIEILIFENTYMKFKDLLFEDNIIGIKGKLNIKGDSDINIQVDNIVKINVN